MSRTLYGVVELLGRCGSNLSGFAQRIKKNHAGQQHQSFQGPGTLLRMDGRDGRTTWHQYLGIQVPSKKVLGFLGTVMARVGKAMKGPSGPG